MRGFKEGGHACIHNGLRPRQPLRSSKHHNARVRTCCGATGSGVGTGTGTPPNALPAGAAAAPCTSGYSLERRNPVSLAHCGSVMPSMLPSRLDSVSGLALPAASLASQSCMMWQRVVRAAARLSGFLRTVCMLTRAPVVWSWVGVLLFLGWGGKKTKTSC